ncbi:hypothetical protein CABS01_15541 [Colletotrichum abscissum]|uniref:uncharacterized protein n=1 Tax=Colletotrichum abscissum TaxID=1671311 RepID=UPI0027D51C7E|nr:uncharacterized protein CABS01_15541 [Colletotrichum abscissum]KAK1475972.1 hypothetical protein CABS01_15541 [Colletotrichum abscissum]
MHDLSGPGASVAEELVATSQLNHCAVNNASTLLPQAAGTGSSSIQLTTAIVDDEPLHPWVYGFDGQPIPQQEFDLENGGDWGVAGESLGPSSTFPGQITALNG